MIATVSAPKNFIACPDLIFAGFSGRINYVVVEKIKNHARFSEFSAWGVSGKIWWDEKTKNWCVEIWKKTSFIATLNTDSIEDLAFNIQKQYGWK